MLMEPLREGTGGAASQAEPRKSGGYGVKGQGGRLLIPSLGWNAGWVLRGRGWFFGFGGGTRADPV